MAPNFLDQGGAFWLIGLVWFMSAISCIWVGLRLGMRYGAPNDGCLISILSVLCTLIGGGLGLLAPGRSALPMSLLGATILPAGALLLWTMKVRPRR